MTLNHNSDKLAGIEFRPAREHERVEFAHALHRGFSGHFNPQPGSLEHDKSAYGPMKFSVCAFDGDEMVGTTWWIPFELTLPGNTTTNFMGVTEVTVAATHTRRGILTEMMRQLLEQGRDAGQHIAGLGASESNIYGRFGYGISGEGHIAKIDTRDAKFHSMPPNIGEVRFADGEKMRRVAPKVWSVATSRTPGMMLRPDAEWDHIFSAKRLKRHGNRAPFFVTYAEEGEYLGYASYRIEHRDDHLHGQNLVRVRELVGTTLRAEAALWRFLLDIDLASEVLDLQHPKNSPLLWLLADPRKLSLTAYDYLWLRIIEPATALSKRIYSAADEVTIEVVDDFCDWTNGTYLLRSDENGVATCERIDRAPDVTLPIASLGAIYMGATRLADLTRAGRVSEHRTGTVARIDNMFNISGVHRFRPDF